MTLAINNRKWLLKNVYIKKKTTTVRKKTVQNGELKFYGGGGRGIFYIPLNKYRETLELIFKIEYSKKHLYTEHLSSAYYILVSKIAC